MESCNTELDVWQTMNSGHKFKVGPRGKVAFLARSNLSVDFRPISNRVATLTLEVGAAKIGLMGC